MQKQTQHHKKNRALRQVKVQIKRLYRQGIKQIKKNDKHKKTGTMMVVILLIVVLALLGTRPPREQKLCMDSFATQFKNAKSVQFKKLTLCPDNTENAGQIYIGTVDVKAAEPLDYACLIIKNQAIVDFERAPAFFYLDNITDKMSPPAKKILCHDIQSLFQKYVQENCSGTPNL